MIANGALDEVANLATRKLDPTLPIMRALGVQPFIAHLQNRISLDDAIEATQAETRHYIKRQLTWFRGHMARWKWLSKQQIEVLKDDIAEIVK